jgi:uncharacterized integral membrane protein (TIGR00698 family)
MTATGLATSPLSSVQRFRQVVPGLALALAVGAGVVALSRVLPTVSPLLVAILLGAVASNGVEGRPALAPGLAVASRRVLRVGVVLLGLQLSLHDITGLGGGVLLLVVAVVVGGVLGTLAIGRLLGVPPVQRLLVACGFSICGAAAVAAVDGVVEADEEDTAAAVAMVVAFGTVMIGLVPAFAAGLGLAPHAAGVLAGASIHEVAQVVAAGGVLGGGALAVAVVVKLARVLLLAPVLAAVSLHRRVAADASAPGQPGTVGRRPPLVPLFAVGFIAAAAVRSTASPPAGVLHLAAGAQVVTLAAAMFALGCGVRVRTLRRLGARPLLLGALSTVLVGSIATAGAILVG